jgi:hypothetical protein
MRIFWILCLGILLVAAGTASAQDIIITEIMPNPYVAFDSEGEWFELYNNTAQDINLNGWILHDNAGSDAIEGDHIIAAHGYFVSCASDTLSANGGVPADYNHVYGTQGTGIALSNTADVLYILTPQSVVVDCVRYNTSYPWGAGFSMQLKSLTYNNDTDSSWCSAQNAWTGSAGDKGTPGEPNDCVTTPCDTLFLTLTEVQENDANGVPTHEGDFVCTRGIANVANYVFDSLTTNFYFQDENAGANIYGSRFPVNATPGDCIVVCGWVTNYNGLCEITSAGGGNCISDIQIVDHVAVPDPLTVTCNTVDQFGEDYEGMLVKIECVSIAGGDPWPSAGQNANVLIHVGTDTCTMRIDKDTNIDGQTPPSEPFTVIGIVNQFDFNSPYTEWYQLLPRSYSDFSICDDAAELAAEIPTSFKLLGSFPNPFNAATRISFTVASRADVSVRIYNLLGREVMKASVAAPTTGTYSYIWNGTDLAGQSVGTGLYLVRVQAGTESAIGKLLFLK